MEDQGPEDQQAAASLSLRGRVWGLGIGFRDRVSGVGLGGLAFRGRGFRGLGVCLGFRGLGV